MLSTTKNPLSSVNPYTIVQSLFGGGQSKPAPEKWKNPFPSYTGNSGTTYFNQALNAANSRSQDRAFADQTANNNAMIAAIRAQTAAMPKLPAFDILGNYNKARTNAEANMRPRYNDMMNQFLEAQGVKKGQSQKRRALRGEQTEADRLNLRADTVTERGRTAEDVAAAIQQITGKETDFQTDEGREFDVARRGLQEGMAGAGLTTSGLGQQAVGEQQDQRNMASGRQVEEFEIQKQAKNLFKNRTFEDLQRKDLRADEKAVLDNKQFDFDLESELQDLAQGEKKYRLDWESDLLGAIGEETGRLDREGVMQFINSLAGSGARAQDIAMAKQVYL